MGEIRGVWEETCLFIYDKMCGYWGSGGGIFIACMFCQREREGEGKGECVK